jgi:hypothetical protein
VGVGGERERRGIKIGKRILYDSKYVDREGREVHKGKREGKKKQQMNEDEKGKNGERKRGGR